MLTMTTPSISKSTDKCKVDSTDVCISSRLHAAHVNHITFCVEFHSTQQMQWLNYKNSVFISFIVVVVVANVIVKTKWFELLLIRSSDKTRAEKIACHKHWIIKWTNLFFPFLLTPKHFSFQHYFSFFYIRHFAASACIACCARTNETEDVAISMCVNAIRYVRRRNARYCTSVRHDITARKK